MKFHFLQKVNEIFFSVIFIVVDPFHYAFKSQFLSSGLKSNTSFTQFKTWKLLCNVNDHDFKTSVNMNIANCEHVFKQSRWNTV